ncbi:hypothetical protein DFH09DRAFT_47189 [Mycena vulgaris]|nr:hypothetical protein DFH09DRAFT_47189 [Mycena vulgaris]
MTDADAVPPPRPSTPLRSPAFEAVHSTPLSRGSGSDENYAFQHTQEDYLPYLEEDLARQKIVPFEKFMELFMPQEANVSASAEIAAIVTNPTFQKLLAAYQQPTRHETDLYDPFVKLANYCLQELAGSSHPNIVFCRNDPAIVRDSHAQRKPDVLTVESTALKIGHRDSVDNLSKTGPTGGRTNDEIAAFHWLEIRGFFEFKVEDSVDAAVPKRVKKPPVAARANKATSPSSGSARVTRSNLPGSVSSGSTSQKREFEGGAVPERAAKRSKNVAPEIQCASYGVELLSHGDLRTHVIGALVTPNTIEMLYYDHSILVKSSPIFFTKEPKLFLDMLSRLASLTPAQWGYSTTLTAAPEPSVGLKDGVSDQIYKGKRLVLENGWTLELGDAVFEAHGLIGRGTCVVRATIIDSTRKDDPQLNKSVIVKWSWSPDTRLKEADIIKKATTRATESGETWVLAHLPVVLHSEEFEDNDSPKIRLSAYFGEEYEGRSLRITVQEELLQIEELASSADFAKAMRDILKCYKWLYEQPGIMHRDISLSNLMYRLKDGQIFGVLNDFDLSVVLNATPQSTSKQRTGTKPYMAIDLLVPEPPTHLYRHDLESLFYAITWFITTFHEGRWVDNPPLWQWKLMGMAALREKKTAFLFQSPPTPTANFTLMGRNWVGPMIRMFGDGIHARQGHRIEATSRDPPFKEETLGGFVTFDKFSAILDRAV